MYSCDWDKNCVVFLDWFLVFVFGIFYWLLCFIMVYYYVVEVGSGVFFFEMFDYW